MVVATRDMTENNSLAVITNATSGIGYALAQRFADAGYDLILAAEDSDVVTVAQDLKKSSIMAQPVQADLSHYGGVERLYSIIKMDGRYVEAIAINAGAVTGGHFTKDGPLQDELKMIGLNVSLVVHLTKRIARDMVTNGRGRILLTLTAPDTLPSPYLAVYRATQAFISSFAESLRDELKDKGVTVTALLPDPFEMCFFDRMGMEGRREEPAKATDMAEIALQGFEAMMAGKDHVKDMIACNPAQPHIEAALTGIFPESIKPESSSRLHQTR